MDIAKYIGLFLTKNRYCFLPNLGEFRVTKQAAKFKDGEVQAPDYDVTFTFSGGLIDDALANFIANSERVSIASSANAIKDFSVNTRKVLSEGGEVIIPGFGKFINVNGQNSFKADPSIQVDVQKMPAFEINTEASRHANLGSSIPEIHERTQIKAPTSDEEIIIKPPTVNWGKILLLIFLALLLVGAVFAAFWYMNQNKAEEEAVPVPVTQDLDTSASQVASYSTQVVDTSQNANPAISTSTTTAAAASGTSVFGILNYADRASAERKEKQLKTYGHNVAIIQNADSTFTLAITIPPVSDTELAKDSLRRFFNPKGTVTVIQ